MCTVTSLTYQPFVPAVHAVIARLADGPVLSSLIVTEFELVPPALVAVQVRVVPVVSAVSVVALHPEEEVMADSGSLTVQLTFTLLVYQPLLPAVPVTLGVMTGGVVSHGLAVTFNVPFPLALSPLLSALVAFTVKLAIPPGVAHVVVIVNVDVFEESPGAKTTGFGEKEKPAPAGNDVVIVKLAEKDPGEPGPLPLFTVTV